VNKEADYNIMKLHNALFVQTKVHTTTG